MYIEELKDAGLGIGEEEISSGGDEKLGTIDAKKVVIGVGARVLFYPTLLYNVIRNKIQAEFRWWDEVDQDWAKFKEILYEGSIHSEGSNRWSWCFRE